MRSYVAHSIAALMKYLSLFLKVRARMNKQQSANKMYSQAKEKILLKFGL